MSYGKREGFRIYELQQLFTQPIFTGCEGRNPGGWKRTGSEIVKDEWYWIPLLALYSGARLAEICFLQTDDVRQEQDIWVLDIHPKHHREGLKNKWSERLIPIHEKLLGYGFVDWVAGLSKKKPVFEKLHSDCVNPSDTFGKRFFNLLQDSNLARKQPPTTSFHSFRHTFKEECRIADIHVHYADRIGGWKPQGHNAGAHYGRTDINHLKTAIDKLMFKGLDIDHLTS